MSRIAVGSIDLPEIEEMYMTVVVRVNDTSLRAYLSECVKGNLQRLRNVYRDRIDIKARELGLTWEQCFNLYYHYEGEATPTNIQSVKQMEPTVMKSYGQTNLGNEEKTK